MIGAFDIVVPYVVFVNPGAGQQAVGLLGGADEVLTPLWWAKK